MVLSKRLPEQWASKFLDLNFQNNGAQVGEFFEIVGTLIFLWKRSAKLDLKTQKNIAKQVSLRKNKYIFRL